ncbi:MAG: 50S ribosomal protein L23 [Candidatus Woykebacteria bacterium]
MTEKSLQEAADGKYTFEVELAANKKEIAKGVEKTFKVDVVDVKTRILKGKRKRIRGTFVERAGPKIKKATVRLGKDQKISVFEVSK